MTCNVRANRDDAVSAAEMSSEQTRSAKLCGANKREREGKKPKSLVMIMLLLVAGWIALFIRMIMTTTTTMTMMVIGGLLRIY